jgi:integrase
MAITHYEQDGKVFWQVYVNVRSKVDPSIRKQKRVCDITSEKAAIAEEKRLLRELSTELAQQEGKGLTWDQVIGRWEMAMRGGQSIYLYQPTTIMDHVALLRKWTASWLERPAAEINSGDAREVLNRVELEGKSRKWQKKVKHTVNVVYTWGVEQRFIRGVHGCPMTGLKLTRKEAEKAPEILTIEEIRKLLCEAKRLDHPWYPVWAMALLTGMRSGELNALLWSDVDLESKRITVSKSFTARFKTVKSTKSGFWRTVPISSELEILLVELKNLDPNREHVLPRFWEWDKGEQARVLQKFCLGIGVKPIKFHTLRACFATQLLANDIAPARVMKICGWRDLKTMQYYIRLAGVEEQGATQVLRVLPSDAAVMGEVVNLFEFKAKRD